MNIVLLEHARGRSKRIKTTIRSVSSDIKCTNIKLYKSAKFPSLSTIDAIIVGGGPMGVYDMNKPEYAFLKKEIEFLLEAIEKKCPILGICFGHQLLAHIMGGKVVKNFDLSEYGWISIRTNAKGLVSPLLSDVSREFWSFSFHGDVVVEKPKSATVLASSSKCDQVFVYEGKNIWSTQFHPEINVFQGRGILSCTQRKLANSGHNVEEFFKSAHGKDQKAGKTIIKNFIQLV